MATYVFTCDARVSREIKAKSEARARKNWAEFCGAINFADDFGVRISEVKLSNFHVSLLDGEPEIEQVE